jgi:serine protease Do
VELANSDEICAGEDVVAVGNPFGLSGTVTSGIVSAKGRNMSGGPFAEFLQTDAAINKGNSGGALFNMEGKDVGVNSAIYSPTGGSVGVGFALTSKIVELIVEDLKEAGQIDRGWLGVAIQDVTPDLAAALGLDAPTGALVASVVPDSPADGEILAGDVILEFGGKKVADSSALQKLFAAPVPAVSSERIFSPLTRSTPADPTCSSSFRPCSVALRLLFCQALSRNIAPFIPTFS